MKNRFMSKKKSLLISICLFLASLCFVSFGSSLNASASSSDIDAELFMPSSNVEYYSLSSPIDAFSDDDVTAIIKSQSLIVYYNGQYITLGYGMFTDLQQVKKLDSKTLLVLDNAAIYLVDLDTLTKEALSFNLDLGGTEIVSCNYFDFNGTHLVTSFNAKIIVYTFNNSTIVSKEIIDGSSKNPIAINEQGKYFYIDADGNLCSRSVNDSSEAPSTLVFSNLKPTKMIADSSKVYYLLDHEIYSIDHDGNNNALLTAQSDSRYDLGKIEYASGISFRNGNLLVCDSIIEAVSEFEINGNSLNFTGFAIAKNKTAFNRISNDVVDIDKDFNTLVVLDGFKLTTIDISGEFSTYDYSRYNEFLQDDLGGEMPDVFAYGNGYALLSYNHFTSSSYLKLLNVNNGEISVEPIKIFEGNVIRDLCYSDGYFYVLADHGDNQSKVYTFSIENQAFLEPIISTNFYAVKLNVDNSKNIYLYSNDGTFNKFVFNNGYALDTTQIITLQNVIEFEFDLANGLYALTNDALCYLDKDGTWQEFTFANIDQDVISFALDFDKKDVYLAVDGEELLYKTDLLNNISIDTIEIPASFILTNANADATGFKAYTTSQPSFAYQVSIDQETNNFTFDTRITNLEEYAFITQVELNDQFGKIAKYYVLAGQNIFVLINEQDAVEHEITFNQAPESAFTTTKVSAYYLPIITPDDLYVCTDTDALVLAKHQQISPIKSFTFLDKDFYLANVTIDQTEYLAYVPVDFTVEILSKDFAWSEYRYEVASSTDVYSDSGLTEKIVSLDNDSEVRVYQQDDNTALITYFSTETNDWELGYINTQAIKDRPYTAVRNVIIILVVALSVCATTVFLIVKKFKK